MVKVGSKPRCDWPPPLNPKSSMSTVLKTGPRGMQFNLWLIHLASGWVARLRERRHLERWTLRERYRCHLIFVKAYEEPDTGGWSAGVQVQFNEGALNFRNVRLPGRTSHFPTKTTAEKQALKEAQAWVDERLRKGSLDSTD
jgi:hypothetical protein